MGRTERIFVDGSLIYYCTILQTIPGQEELKRNMGYRFHTFEESDTECRLSRVTGNGACYRRQGNRLSLLTYIRMPNVLQEEKTSAFV